ncbi:peptidase S26 [Burkholderia cepacia]|uniref:S26 family signal peptidase n=1 Tax=Burkholderia cepacia TaxID=292 RepID=UPI0007550D74|nr:S26 family signal peptidase [Burkholderia cepacia]KVV25064.1 peptidase S26 [Burkholderia cepacia]
MNVKRICLAVCGSVLAVGLLATAATPWVDFDINLTKSLPGTLYVIQKGAGVTKGDTVAFRWRGGATYPAGVTFIKRVTGVAGDVVRRDGNRVWVGDQYVGVAKPVSRAGVPLIPAAAGVIPRGEYFVSTPHPDSLDSRYAITGNIKDEDVIGRAYAIF